MSYYWITLKLSPLNLLSFCIGHTDEGLSWDDGKVTVWEALNQFVFSFKSQLSSNFLSNFSQTFFFSAETLWTIATLFTLLLLFLMATGGGHFSAAAGPHLIIHPEQHLFTWILFFHFYILNYYISHRKLSFLDVHWTATCPALTHLVSISIFQLPKEGKKKTKNPSAQTVCLNTPPFLNKPPPSLEFIFIFVSPSK